MYALSYNKSYDGTEQTLFELYNTLEELLSDINEYGLKKGQFKIFSLEELGSADILSLYSQEIGEYKIDNE